MFGSVINSTLQLILAKWWRISCEMNGASVWLMVDRSRSSALRFAMIRSRVRENLTNENGFLHTIVSAITQLLNTFRVFKSPASAVAVGASYSSAMAIAVPIEKHRKTGADEIDGGIATFANCETRNDGTFLSHGCDIRKSCLLLS